MEPEKSILKEFLNGGWLVPLIGAAAMFARLLSGKNELSVKQQFKRIFTAALASGIAWFVLEQTDISSLTKAITYGIIGVVSPEVIGGLVKLAKNFEKNPFKFIKK
jgi:Na+/citrate or Na+/malate symporter|tara:strand:- start:271 stop:588 length:318 start_codon:yes stop_codon:yes gene_type:complete